MTPEKLGWFAKTLINRVMSPLLYHWATLAYRVYGGRCLREPRLVGEALYSHDQWASSIFLLVAEFLTADRFFTDCKISLNPPKCPRPSQNKRTTEELFAMKTESLKSSNATTYHTQFLGWSSSGLVVRASTEEANLHRMMKLEALSWTPLSMRRQVGRLTSSTV